MLLLRMHAIISGRVQGVCFRATTRDLARQMGVTGTVKNLPDGTVEIYAQATQEKLDQLVASLREKFDIESIKKDFSEAVLKKESFEIIR